MGIIQAVAFALGVIAGITVGVPLIRFLGDFFNQGIDCSCDAECDCECSCEFEADEIIAGSSSSLVASFGSSATPAGQPVRTMSSLDAPPPAALVAMHNANPDWLIAVRVLAPYLAPVAAVVCVVCIWAS